MEGRLGFGEVWCTIICSFVQLVHALLQKPNKKQDLYNITRIIEILEQSFQEKYIAVKIDVVLRCRGYFEAKPAYQGLRVGLLDTGEKKKRLLFLWQISRKKTVKQTKKQPQSGVIPRKGNVTQLLSPGYIGWVS